MSWGSGEQCMFVGEVSLSINPPGNNSSEPFLEVDLSLHAVPTCPCIHFSYILVSWWLLR